MNDLQSGEIRIDKDGVWFYRGAEMFRREIVNFFYEHLKLDETGRYVIELPNDRCYVDVEDTAYVVRSVWLSTRQNRDGVFYLLLSDDTVENLDPTTLWIGRDNVLYCRIRNGLFPARFSRAGYYQLAAHIQYDAEKDLFFLPSGGQRYYIKTIES